MKKDGTAGLLAWTLLLLGGCAAPLTAEQMAHADFGPYPENYQSIIMRDVVPPISYNTSPFYDIIKPEKQGRSGNPPIFGWRVCGTIFTHKNGPKTEDDYDFYVLIRDGQVVDELITNYNSSFFTGVKREDLCDVQGRIGF
jgi:hypothetical protein